MDDFGAQLKDLRTRYGMTQADLARLSDLGQSTISALETGRQNPWPSTRRALSHAFQMSLEEFDAITLGTPPMSTPSRSMGGGRRGFASPWQPAPGFSGGAGEEAETPMGRTPPRPAPAGAADRRAGEATGDYPFAQSKVMQLLNELGDAEQRLEGHEQLIRNLCPVCWITDSTLHLTGAWGLLAEELHPQVADLVGAQVRDFLDAALGAGGPESPLLAVQRKAATGLSVSLPWEHKGRRFIIYIDPVRGSESNITGTVGLAVDITNRQGGPAAR